MATAGTTATAIGSTVATVAPTVGGAITSTLGAVVNAGSALGGAIGGMSGAAQAALVTAGSSALQQRGAREDAKAYKKELDVNNAVQLNTLEDTRGILERTGYYSKEQQGVAQDASGQSIYQSSAEEQRAKTSQAPTPQAFNQSNNTWDKVGS